MKASLLIGAILLVSLVMADERAADNPSPDVKQPALGTKPNGTDNSSSILMFEGPISFLVPLVLMVIHLLHMY